MMQHGHDLAAVVRGVVDHVANLLDQRLGELGFRVAGLLTRKPEKVGTESDYYWMVAAGLEYPIPSAVVKPYFGVDAMYVSINNTGSGSSSASRGGVGLGAGVEFSLPGVGSFDTSVKYQIINVLGKESNETTAAQVVGSVALMFGVL